MDKVEGNTKIMEENIELVKLKLQALEQEDIIRLLLSLMFIPEAKEALISSLSKPEIEQAIFDQYIYYIEDIFAHTGCVLQGGIPIPKSGTPTINGAVVINPSEEKKTSDVTEYARDVLAEYLKLQQPIDMVGEFQRQFAYNCALYMNSFAHDGSLDELFEIFKENYLALLEYFKKTTIDPYKRNPNRTGVGSAFPLVADLESFIGMVSEAVKGKKLAAEKLKPLTEALKKAKKARPDNHSTPTKE